MIHVPGSSFFETGDWIVIAAYLIGVIAFGIWAGRGQKTTKDYFLGNRNVPWWGVGLSIIATETSALTIIGVPALAYGGNLGFIQIVIGYVIARMILAAVMVPHYFKGEIYSPYQMFGDAFGPAAQRTAAFFFLVSGVLGAGVRVYVTSIPLQLMLGVNILTSILVFVSVSLVYTYVGGLKAVIWTDAVQFFLFLAGGIFTVCYVPQLFDGGFSEAFTKAAAGGKLVWLNTKFSLGGSFNIWMGLIGGTVHVMSTHGADQLIVQRVLACGSVKDGRKALILSGVIILPLMLIFLLAGAMLWVYYQNFPMAIQIPATAAGMKKNDYIFPIFIMTAVPTVLKGFLIVAILSAAMSSVSSAMSALASVSTMDLFRIGGSDRSAASALRFSKFSTVFWAAMLIGVAYLSREVEFVLNVAFKLSGFTTGAMLGGLILSIWRPRGVDARSLITGMLCSLCTIAFIAVVPMVKPELWKKLGGVEILWPWYTLIGVIVTIGMALVSSKIYPAAVKKG